MDPAQSIPAAAVVQAGATEIMRRPLDPRTVGLIVANARDRARGNPPDARMVDAVDGPLFAESPAMRLALEAMRAEAHSRLGTAMCGESGSGRRFMARVLRELAQDSSRPLVEVQCAGRSPLELERHLFGETTERRTGGDLEVESVTHGSAVARAQGGSLLFIDLDQAPNRIQARLARILRDREVRMAGGAPGPVELDIRPVAILDTTTDERLRDGQLRTDLYTLVTHVRLDVPLFAGAVKTFQRLLHTS